MSYDRQNLSEWADLPEVQDFVGTRFFVFLLRCVHSSVPSCLAATWPSSLAEGTQDLCLARLPVRGRWNQGTIFSRSSCLAASWPSSLDSPDPLISCSPNFGTLFVELSGSKFVQSRRSQSFQFWPGQRSEVPLLFPLSSRFSPPFCFTSQSIFVLATAP